MTQELYYIQHEDRREGPLDMLALMRKIRAGKIDGNTPITTDYQHEAYPLSAYPSLEHLLTTAPQHSEARDNFLRAEALFARGFMSGARLINRHLHLCVISGLFVLLLLLLATLAGSVTSFLGGYLIWLLCALTLLPSLQLLSMRLFRGHYSGMAVVRNYLEAALPHMLLMGILLALCVMAGTALFLLPGIIILTLTSYAVPLAAEGNRSAVQCLLHSARMVLKGGVEHAGALFGFATINLLSALCIIPLPVLWPLMAGAIADCYEDAGR